MALSHKACQYTAQLRKAQEENDRLKKEKLENQKGENKTKQKARIPRPPGGVSAWKLQEAMQLTGSVEKSEMYAGIQVSAHCGCYQLEISGLHDAMSDLFSALLSRQFGPLLSIGRIHGIKFLQASRPICILRSVQELKSA